MGALGGIFRAGAGLAKLGARTGAGAAKAGAKASPSFLSRIGNFPWQAAQWGDFFKNWIPGITVTYRIKAQGAPNTPTRTVLHLALAAAFGLSVSRRVANIKIQAGINHTENSVEVIYTVSTVSLEFALSSFLPSLFGSNPVDGKAAKGAADGSKPPEGPIAGKNAQGNALTAGVYAEFATDPNPTQAPRLALQIAQDPTVQKGYESTIGIIDGSADAKNILAKEVARGQDLDAQRAALMKKLEGQLANQNKALQAQKNNDAKNVSPGVEQKPIAVQEKTRGVLGNVGNVVRDAPNLVDRNPAAGAAGVAPLAIKLVEQVDKLDMTNGPKMLFELAPGQVFSGPAPLVLNIGNNAIPFSDMVKANAPANNNPILTRALAVNPQFPQSLGVDLVTLVAQVLFDPGTLPPRPRTHAGPPTTMDD